MAKQQKRRIRECAYCGEFKETTRDHVIPKAVFTQPYPSNLITVSACDSCNGIKKSASDTLLRGILTTDFVGSQHPKAQKLFLEKVVKAHNQNQSPFTKNVVENAQLQPFYTPQGIYLDDYFQLKLPLTEVIEIFAFIIRGLYYHHERKRIPDSYTFEVKRHMPWDFKPLKAEFQQKTRPYTRELEDVFGYAFILDPNDRFSSVWLLWFYKEVGYSVITEKL